MATFGKGLRGKQLEALEAEATGSTPAKKDNPTPAEKPKRAMTQAQFSGYDKPKVEKKAAGGVVGGRRGYGLARGGRK